MDCLQRLRDLDSHDWQLFASMATVATALLAAVALFGAYRQILRQREAAAHQRYADYLKLAVDRPRLANARLSIPVELAPGDLGPSAFQRYEWFVSVMLQAFEEILDLRRHDKEWKRAIQDQLKYHKPYLDSSHFELDHYSPRLKKLIELVRSQDRQT